MLMMPYHRREFRDVGFCVCDELCNTSVIRCFGIVIASFIFQIDDMSMTLVLCVQKCRYLTRLYQFEGGFLW
jgi:hypothetical protein